MRVVTRATHAGGGFGGGLGCEAAQQRIRGRKGFGIVVGGRIVYRLGMV